VRTHLLSATRAAFASGTSVGLRVGGLLILLTAVAVAHQHPRAKTPPGQRARRRSSEVQ